MCLLAVVVAAVTARFALPAPGRRTRFISEILAAWVRVGHEVPSRFAWWGSALANFLLGAGAVLFTLEATRRAGLDGGASLATGLTLLAVAAVPLRVVEHPDTARGLDFGHPFAAAGFYLAALLLGLVGLRDAGPIGEICAIVHVGSSVVLIGLSISTGFQEFGPRGGSLPIAGTRVLLDVRADSSARYVRWFQWPATFALGVSLCVAALGR